MTPLKLVHYPHPALRVKARPVLALDAGVVAAANDMLALMYKKEGLGLAASRSAWITRCSSSTSRATRRPGTRRSWP